PRQAAFMARSEYEALYGGAAGGGKSDALVVEALRQVNIPWYKGLILRKTYPDLTELIEKSLRYYTQSYPGARYNDSKHFWQFPSGAKIYFGAMQYTKDRTKYQGKAYDYIAFDELTHFTWDEYSYLFSRNRPNGPGTHVYIRASANPGGIGHAWVKKYFVTPAKPLSTIWRRVVILFPDGHKEERWSSRVYVPATVFDNRNIKTDNTAIVKKQNRLKRASVKGICLNK
ncbi:MAG: phage terminase large subunit, partial [Selenomonadaceae bacterium]